MEKTKHYRNVKFSSRTVRNVIDKCRAISTSQGERLNVCKIRTGDEEWNLDSVEEFLTAYSNNDVDSVHLNILWDNHKLALSLFFLSGGTMISITGGSRTSIESIFSVFEEAPSEDRLIASEKRLGSEITIFIGHGRSNQWTKLKSHLQDKHGLNVVSYEAGARAGHTIRDILDSLSEKASLALLILTGEDKTKDGLRARQNVIHECGLFQGRLGFDRAILVVEQGIELASNFDGIQQLRFKKGRISEVFGDVVATIRREFGPV